MMKEISMSGYHVKLIEEGKKWTTIRSLRYAKQFRKGEIVKLRGSDTLIKILDVREITVKDIDENIVKSEGYNSRERLLQVLKWFLKNIDEDRRLALITFQKI